MVVVDDSAAAGGPGMTTSTAAGGDSAGAAAGTVSATGDGVAAAAGKPLTAMGNVPRVLLTTGGEYVCCGRCGACVQAARAGNIRARSGFDIVFD